MNIQALELYESNFGKMEDFKKLTETEQTNLLAERFLTLNKRSVSSILLMSFIVFSIRNKDEMFNEFAKKIRMTVDLNSSQFRKYCVIGGNFNKLTKFIDSLPCRWSTIYKIAKLEESTLKNLVDEGHLHRSRTAEEIDAHLPKKRKAINCNSSKLNSLTNKIQIQVIENLTADQIHKIIDTLDTLKSEKLIEFDVPEIVHSVTASANDLNIGNLLAA